MLPALDDENNPYDWPYSNKCPSCGARAMVGIECMACGEDQHQERCPICGRWQNHHHLENGGCVYAEYHKKEYHG